MLAAAGAVLVLFSFLGTIAQLAGLALIVVATVLTAGKDAGWRRMLVLGAVISAVGVPLSLLLGTIGGLLAGIGGALVIVAVAFAWPTGRPTARTQAPPAR